MRQYLKRFRNGCAIDIFQSQKRLCMKKHRPSFPFLWCLYNHLIFLNAKTVRKLVDTTPNISPVRRSGVSSLQRFGRNCLSIKVGMKEARSYPSLRNGPAWLYRFLGRRYRRVIVGSPGYQAHRKSYLRIPRPGLDMMKLPQA